jgi:hypothetical protein
MSDDLVKRLEDGCGCNLPSTSCAAESECKDAFEAAACIKALKAQLAERDKACAEWSEVSQRNYQRAKTAEADRDQWRSMWEKEQTDNEQLQAQLAEYQSDCDDYREQFCIDRDARIAAEAQLAKAREDVLREAANFIRVKQAKQKMACVVWPEEILALLDTPTPAPSPDALVEAAEMMVKAYREESDRVITAFYALEDALAAMKGNGGND